MCDRITYCDICECAECPKYGDDCDGDKRNDDLISRTDAIEAVCGVVIDEFDVSPTRGYEVAEHALSALPSAEAVSREEYDQLEALYDAIRVYDSSAEAKGDLISRADAIEAVASITMSIHLSNVICDKLSALPSAEYSKQLQTTLNGDLVSRADAIDCCECHGSQECKDRIKALPSAEAVQGEWVRKYDDEINCYWYECDQCGEYRPRNIFGHEYDSNFCPKCGAKMTKGGGNE